jgi:hypothetical protein
MIAKTANEEVGPVVEIEDDLHRRVDSVTLSAASPVRARYEISVANLGSGIML